MEHMQTCPKCGDDMAVRVSCPSSEFRKGKIVDLCPKCKMEEVTAIWSDRRPEKKGGGFLH